MEVMFVVKHATSGVNDWLARTRDGRVYTPAAYKNFVSVITAEAMVAMRKLKAETIMSPVRVSIYAYIKNKKKDIDNFIKPVLDGLQKGGVIGNDSQVTVLHVEKLSEMEGDTLVIQVVPL